MTINCPYCGKSYYIERYAIRTAMYFPPIYKDGVNINPDKNITTHVCECMSCGQIFSWRERGGEPMDE